MDGRDGEPRSLMISKTMDERDLQIRKDHSFVLMECLVTGALHNITDQGCIEDKSWKRGRGHA